VEGVEDDIREICPLGEKCNSEEADHFFNFKHTGVFESSSSLDVTEEEEGDEEDEEDDITLPPSRVPPKPAEENIKLSSTTKKPLPIPKKTPIKNKNNNNNNDESSPRTAGSLSTFIRKPLPPISNEKETEKEKQQKEQQENSNSNNNNNNVEISAGSSHLRFRTPTFGMNAAGETCRKCGKDVILSEKVVTDCGTLHKSCFRCSVCDCVLNLGLFHAFLDDTFYCKTHYDQTYNK